MKKNLKLVLLIIGSVCALVCLCSFVLVGLIVYETDGEEKNKTLIEKAEVLTPKDILEFEEDKLKEESFKNVKILYAESSLKEKDYIKFLLESKGINDQLSENSKEIVIIVYSGINDEDLEKSKGEKKKIIVRDAFTYSGNHIYVTKNDFVVFEDIQRAYRNLYAGILNAELFYVIPENEIQISYESGKAYNIEKSSLVQKYTEKTGPVFENDKWRFKTPDQKISYSNSDFCNEMSLIEELVLCEAVVYQTELSKSIPAETQLFLKDDLKIVEGAEYSSLNISTPDHAEKLATQYKLTKSPFFYVVEIEDIFTDDEITVTSESTSYSKVSQKKLDEIKNDLIKNQWVFVKETSPVRDSSTGIKEKLLIFKKENFYLYEELVISVADTSTMNSDCVSSALNKNRYCDSKSIYKGTGYIIQFSIANKTKYL